MSELKIVAFKRKPDIICISETWCNNFSVASIKLDGYDVVTHYNRDIHKNGGVLMLVRNSLKCEEITFIRRLSIEMHLECCAMSVSICNVKYFIVTVYRSPSGNISTFIDVMTSILNYCIVKSDYLIIMGDFNIDWLKECYNKNLLYDLMRSYSMSFKNNSPSRVFTNESGVTSTSKIDYIFTNVKDDDYIDEIENLNIADHCANILYLRGSTQIEEPPLEKVLWRDTSQNRINDLVT